MRNIDIDAFRGANPTASGRSTRTGGFTLIELLVVIAIIAILAAIIFPVFSAVRENAREATTMSNLHNVSSALALYKLDNRHYPDVLFAYACDQNASAADGCRTTDNMQSITSDGNATNELVGLYPEYIKDWQSFTCPNNTENTNNGAYFSGKGVNVICPKSDAKGVALTACQGVADGELVAEPKAFFAEDAMDMSPEIYNVNQFVNNSTPQNWIYLPRYQTSWMSYDNGTNGNANIPDYIRQLRWINPPADTYVTSVTYHVPNADKLIVLYESGSAQVLKVPVTSSWFTGNPNPDQAYIDNQQSIAVGGAGGNSPAAFWQYNATQ